MLAVILKPDFLLTQITFNPQMAGEDYIITIKVYKDKRMI